MDEQWRLAQREYAEAPSPEAQDRLWNLSLKLFIGDPCPESLRQLACSRPDLRIIATFYPQYDADGYIYYEQDSELWGTTFDVTDKIVEMSYDEAVGIEDDQLESDALLPVWIEEQHGGPFRIEVRDSIENYFKELFGPYYSLIDRRCSCGSGIVVSASCQWVVREAAISCDNGVCEDCLQQCDNCNKILCHEHYVRCHECGYLGCDDHVGSTETCWPVGIVACNGCGVSLCETCSAHCATFEHEGEIYKRCNQRYCEQCASTHDCTD